MKKTANCILAPALFALSISVQAAPKSLAESLSPWAPLSVTLNAGTLKIVTPQDRVTDSIYSAILKHGVCGSLWLNPGGWSGVTEVQVLNKYARQGYVFEGGENECAALGKLSGEESDRYVLGLTRLN